MTCFLLAHRCQNLLFPAEGRPFSSVSGKMTAYWCKLGVTLLLLVCEVSVSQVCKSFITLVDAFHTLFTLIHLALPPSQTAQTSSPSAPAFILNEQLPGQRADTSDVPVKSSDSRSDHEAGSVVNCNDDFSPPALICGLSYPSSRTQPVGSFLSALLLASLCIACLLEIISFHLSPQPVHHPQLLVAVAAFSLLHKMLVLELNWDQRRGRGFKADRERQTDFYLEVNHRALAEEETRAQTEPGRVLDDLSRVQSAADNSFHNGALVLCNPAASTALEPDSQTADQQQELQQPAAAPQDIQQGEVVRTFTDLKEKDSKETSNDSTGREHLDSEKETRPSAASMPAHPSESCRFPAFLVVIQGLFTSVLALVNSLMMLLISPQCPHSSGPCSLLLYLDPGVSILAVIILITRAAPQVHRYGLLLMQATPPHVCVLDLEQRIASIPGVQAVHHLHIWELTDSFMVASVHVHCHAGFPTHRCADLILGVTKVLQSAGVSCCTIQPEFVACCSSPASGQTDSSAAVHGGDASLCPVTTCEEMCSTPAERDHENLPTPATKDTREKN